MTSLSLAWLSAREEFLSWKDTSSRTNVLLIRIGNCLTKTALTSFIKQSTSTAQKPIFLCYDFGRDDGQYGDIPQLCLYLIYRLSLSVLEENHEFELKYPSLPGYVWTDAQLWGYFRCFVSTFGASRPIILMLNGLEKCERSSMWFLEDLVLLNEDRERKIKVIITDPSFEIEGIKLDLQESLPKVVDPPSVVDIFIKSSARKDLQKEIIHATRRSSG